VSATIESGAGRDAGIHESVSLTREAPSEGWHGKMSAKLMNSFRRSMFPSYLNDGGWRLWPKGWRGLSGRIRFLKWRVSF